MDQVRLCAYGCGHSTHHPHSLKLHEEYHCRDNPNRKTCSRKPKAIPIEPRDSYLGLALTARQAIAECVGAGDGETPESETLRRQRARTLGAIARAMFVAAGGVE